MRSNKKDEKNRDSGYKKLKEREEEKEKATIKKYDKINRRSIKEVEE